MRQNSLVQLMQRVEQSEGASYYRTVSKMGKKHGMTDEYVVVLKNHTFFCTCLLLQNAGLACRHFFCVLQEFEDDHKYHIGWLAKRWFKEEWLTLSDMEFNQHFQSHPFLGAGSSQNEPVFLMGRTTGVSGLSKAISKENSIPTPKASTVHEKRRYAQILGPAKGIANDIKSSPKMFVEVKQLFDRLEALVARAKESNNTKDAGVEDVEYASEVGGEVSSNDEGEGEGSAEIKNPVVSRIRGRKRKSERIKASFEPKPKHKRKQK